MSRELEVRNLTMYQMYATGKPVQVIADTFGVSRQRAQQIIARYAAEASVTDEESRGLHRAQLEGLMSEMMGITFGPAPPSFNVKGDMLFDENGDPVRDVAGKINAAIAALRISDAIRRMDAIDKPRRKQVAENEAMQQVKEFLAALPKAQVVETGQDDGQREPDDSPQEP